MEIPTGINPSDDAVHPDTDMPRYTPLEQLMLAVAPVAGISRVLVDGIHAQPPMLFPGQGTYVQERSSIVTIDGKGGGPVHLVAMTIPIELAVRLQRAFDAARGTKLAEGLAAKCGDHELGGRVNVHRGPAPGVQG